MNSERWERIEELFHAALELLPEEREAFLKEACDEDPELQREIESLLAFDDPDESFLESPAIQLAARELAAESVPQQEIPTQSMSSPESGNTPAEIAIDFDDLAPGCIVGNYRILNEIGSGGMGEVYLAEDLKLQRRVALKLLPSALGVASQFVERFRREARTASALNHPHIVTIHSIEEYNGLNFIDMEYVEGETLKEKLIRGPLALPEVLELGRQIAGGMQVAHEAGVIHRDLKPGNLLVTKSGQIKIVDFGLAKMIQESVIADARKSHPEQSSRLAIDALSQAGSISGTIPYMSPEQTRGMELDCRTDLFSLGCVLYEALTGVRPFQGETSRDIIDEILMKEPRPPSQLRREITADIDRIIKQALSKDKTQRYQSAAELDADLSNAIRRRSFRQTLKRLAQAISLVLIVILLSGWWLYARKVKKAWAARQLPEVQRLIWPENNFFAAHDLGEQLAAYIPNDARLQKLRQHYTDVVSIVTDPPGATVYLQRYQKDESGRFPPRQRIGVTPLREMMIPRGDYLLTLEKPGYEPFQRTVSSALDRLERGLWESTPLLSAELLQNEAGEYVPNIDWLAPIELEIKLFSKGTVPEKMVYVPGGNYRLIAARSLLNEPVPLDDFWIDSCEVTNREFKEFVDAGGYRKREYWPETFLDQLPQEHGPESVPEPRELTWEQALPRFVDRTGLPGPAGWSQQNYPKGQAEYPVTGVSWYEAAAYAAFRGKQLPTVFQWEKAARDGLFTHLWGDVKPWGLTGLNEDLADRTNIRGDGTVPVGSYPFGMSVYGCYDMCGNAAEWCENQRPHGFSTMGSSWSNGPHHFGQCGQYPGLYRADTIGFRCVQQAAPSERDQGAAIIVPERTPLVDYHPVNEEIYRQIITHYEYDRIPLHEEVLETVETNDWTRIKVRFVGARGQNNSLPVPVESRVPAYLWLPKNAVPPFQVIFYKPGGASYQGLTAPQETEMVCGPFLKSGRAVYEVLLEGMTERPLPLDWKSAEMETVAYRDMVIYDVIDQRIGLDYLIDHHPEIDKDRLASMSLSMGGYDLPMLAIEERFNAHFLISAGLAPGNAKRVIAAANPVNFAPYIRGPKLMIHGRYDEGIPFETMTKPLFDLLSEPKEMHVLETGHFPPFAQWYPIAQDFFDRTLGPVKLKQNSSQSSQ